MLYEQIAISNLASGTLLNMFVVYMTINEWMGFGLKFSIEPQLRFI